MSAELFNEASNPQLDTGATAMAIGGAYVQAGNHDPSVIATVGVAGTIFIQVKVYGQGGVGLFQKQDDGLSTNWTQISSNALDYKDPVDAASLANVNIAVAPASLDGVLGVIGQRWLLKNQTLSQDNGIYIFNGAGVPLTRSPDADTDAEVTQGLFTWVLQGTQANTAWMLVTPNPITLGVTPLTFVQVPGAVPVAVQNTVFVSKNGNDATGDGTLSKPYLTIGQAASVIGSATSNADFNDATKRYYTVKVGPGLYTESPTFGTRPFIRLDLESASIVGNLTIQFAQGTIFGAGLQSPHFVLSGGVVRPVAGGTPTIGIVGNLIYESTVSGSSLVALLENIGCAIQGNVVQQLGAGGGTFTLTHFVSSGIITGSILNNTLAGSHTLYVDNSDDSSGNSIGAVNGVVNLNILSNVRFTGIVAISGAQTGRWFDVSFAALAHNFTGATGVITADANSYQSYFANVPTKGAETFTLVDNARGITFTPTTPLDWPVVPTTVQQALDTLGAETTLVSIQNEIFVSKNGNDGTGDGSLSKPFLTIAAAMAAITTATAANRFVIQVGPGKYIEGAFVHKANVTIKGQGQTNTEFQPASFALSPDWSVVDGMGGIIDFTISSALVINFTTVGSANGRFLIQDCAVAANISSTGGTGFTFLSFNNCIFSNGAQITHTKALLSFMGGGSLNTGEAIIVTEDTTAITVLAASKGQFTGNITLTGVGGGSGLFAFFTSFTTIGNITATGATTTASFSVESFPTMISSLIFSGGATYSWGTQAFALGYIPAVPASWSPVPTDVKGALDQLISRAVETATSFVFKPGGVAGGNIYTTWPSLIAAMSVNAGPKTIYFDDSIVSPAVIPAGAYALEEVTFNNADLSGSTSVQVADGVSWTGLRVIKNLAIEFLNSVVVETLPAAAMYFDGVAITASGTAEIWATPIFNAVKLENGSSLNGIPASEVFAIGAGATLVMSIQTRSGMNADTISGDGSTTLVESFNDDSNGVVAVQTSFTGALVPILNTDAERLGYTPAVPGDWSPAPDDVKEALDQLAASVSGTNTPERETFVLTAPDIANGYLDLAFIASFNTVIVNLQGTSILFETDDYTLSNLVVTRVTFDPAVVATLVVGQKVQIQYSH